MNPIDLRLHHPHPQVAIRHSRDDQQELQEVPIAMAAALPPREITPLHPQQTDDTGAEETPHPHPAQIPIAPAQDV